MANETAAGQSKGDARPLSTRELFTALQGKFATNFTASQGHLVEADQVQSDAIALSQASEMLRVAAGDLSHQQQLAACLDELFADSNCAIYLASCGLNVPARMLIRRCVEIGLVVVSYWDSPASFWQWREHDGDIRFAELCANVKNVGYQTFLKEQVKAPPSDVSATLSELADIYGKLSDVVHPKPYNFSTALPSRFAFDLAEFRKTLGFAHRASVGVARLLIARFPQLQSTLASVTKTP